MEILLISILAIVIVGCIYQKSCIYFDNKKYPPVGEIVEVNDHNMHIYSKGQGKVTVVFTSGSGVSSPYVDMYPLYNVISRYARIVVYDRPGYGWSEQTQNSRDIDTVVKELHTLLEKSGEKPPYILVGHSMAGLEVLRFTQIYKNEVKGIVMVDGAAPNYCFNFKDTMGTTSHIIQFVKNI